MHPITPLPSCDVSDLRKDIVAHITARRRRFRVKSADIDDLAQTALTKVLASIDNYRAERGEFRAWVFGIVHNVLCHHARDMHRYNERFSEYCHNVDDYETPEPSPEKCAQRTQARSEISNVVDNFEPKHWAVFTLHTLDELPHKEIGRELGISEAASQKCYQRTRNKLAQCLDNELVIVMPLVAIGCDDKRSDRRVSRWSWVYYGGHYTSQIVSLVAAGLLALSLKTPPDTGSNEVPTMDCSLPVVAVPQDKPAPALPSETITTQDKPVEKREAAPAPRVRAVLAPKTTVGKPTPTTYVPSFNPPASPAAYRQRGR